MYADMSFNANKKKQSEENSGKIPSFFVKNNDSYHISAVKTESLGGENESKD